MNVLVDTNVWLDVLQDRAPHYEASARALSVLEAPQHMAFLGATTVTTIFYLVSKNADDRVAHEQIARLLAHYPVAPVDAAVLQSALDAGFSDYEDAVLDRAAHRIGADAIVTRNVGDFEPSRLAVYTPDELVAALRI